MTVIVYYRTTMERYDEITRIDKVPGMVNLYRGKDLIAHVTIAMKLEVI